MNLHERMTGKPVVLEQPRNARFGGGPGDERKRALVEAGVDADATKRVEVRFDHMPGARKRLRDLVREASLPEAAASANARTDRPAHAEQPRKPCAAPVLGQVHQKVVAACPQLREQLPRRGCSAVELQ